MYKVRVKKTKRYIIKRPAHEAFKEKKDFKESDKGQLYKLKSIASKFMSSVINDSKELDIKYSEADLEIVTFNLIEA